MPDYKLRKGTVHWNFWQSRAKLQFFGGGFGNGKTTAAVAKAIKFSIDYPGSNGLIARATYPKLNDTIRKKFLEWCPPDLIRRMPTKDDNTAILHNDTTVNFRYVAQRGKKQLDGQTSSNLLSAEYDWIVVDQIEDPEMSYKDFLDLLGRLRGQTEYRPIDEEDPTMPSTGPRVIVITANPTHNWVFKELVQPFFTWRDKGVKTDKLLMDEKTGRPIMELFEGPTSINEWVPQDYIDTQSSTLKGQMRERFFEGKWSAFEGLVHPDFDDAYNVVTRDQAMQHLLDCKARYVKVRPIEAYDFGLVSPSCYAFGFVDDAGRVILLDGFHKADFNYTLQPVEIKRIRAKYSDLLSVSEPIIADPAIFRSTVVGKRTTNTTIAKLFREPGMDLYMVPGSNDIVSGIAKVNGYIAGGEDFPHIITGASPGPLLYVVDELEWFMDEIYSYYWKRNPQGQFEDEPMDANDHAMNMVKYMLSKLPDPAELKIPASALPPGWMRWYEVDPETRSVRR